jgi:hypothetical protein
MRDITTTTTGYQNLGAELAGPIKGNHPGRARCRSASPEAGKQTGCTCSNNGNINRFENSGFVFSNCGHICLHTSNAM